MDIREDPVQEPAPLVSPGADPVEELEEIQEVQELSEERPSGDSKDLFNEDINPDTEATFDLQAEFAAAAKAAPPPPSPPQQPPQLKAEATQAATGYIRATDSIHVDSAMYTPKTENQPKAEEASNVPEKKAAPKKKYTVTLTDSPSREPVAGQVPAKKHGWFAIPVVIFLVVVVSAVILWQLLKGMEVPRQAVAGVGVAKSGDTASDHYSQGNKYFENQQYYLALDEYKAAMKLNPDLALAHRGMGVVLGKLGKTEDAVKQYEEYLKLAPTAADADEVRKIVKEYYGK
jgi:tetratricopeptide (TPR) repeat protein